jgi:acetyl esterase/lipase
LLIENQSAGGHLTTLTTFHLQKTRPKFSLRGVVLNFGCYDLSLLPQVFNYKKPEVLVLDLDIAQRYLDVFLPGIPVEKRKDPSISPAYADLTKMKLPSALFTCGTEDCLLDDTVYMGVKWQMTGAEAIIKIYPGGPHGFIMFPPEHVENAKKGMDDVLEYLNSKLA